MSNDFTLKVRSRCAAIVCTDEGFALHMNNGEGEDVDMTRAELLAGLLALHAAYMVELSDEELIANVESFSGKPS